MPSEKLYAHPKSVPAPAPICLVVSTHSDPVLKNPDGPASGAGNFDPESVKSLTDASSTRVANRQPGTSAAPLVRPAATGYFVDDAVFCQVRQVTLSVIVPSPLS